MKRLLFYSVFFQYFKGVSDEKFKVERPKSWEGVKEGVLTDFGSLEQIGEPEDWVRETTENYRIGSGTTRRRTGDGTTVDTGFHTRYSPSEVQRLVRYHFCVICNLT